MYIYKKSDFISVVITLDTTEDQLLERGGPLVLSVYSLKASMCDSGSETEPEAKHYWAVFRDSTEGRCYL